MSKMDNDIKFVALAFLFIFMMTAGASVSMYLEKHSAPTYHCDGPGYPAPGTAEARACWIEGAK